MHIQDSTRLPRVNAAPTRPAAPQAPAEPKDRLTVTGTSDGPSLKGRIAAAGAGQAGTPGASNGLVGATNGLVNASGPAVTGTRAASVSPETTATRATSGLSATAGTQGPETGFLVAGQVPDKTPEVFKTGFNRANMDLSVDPGQDFFRYAMGSYLRNHPIPEAYSSWGVDAELTQQVRQNLRSILEEAAAAPHSQGSLEQKLGDFYASGMDLEAIERAGTRAIDPYFAMIDSIAGPNQVQATVAQLHLQGIPSLFSFGSGQDARDSSQVVGQAYQGGLGLPDRDYYFGEEHAETRAAYHQYVENMFALLGQDAETAKKSADTVMRVETDLAAGHLTRVELRDPESLVNPKDRAALAEMTPDFSWDQYLQSMDLTHVGSINVATPKYFQHLNKVLKDTPIEEMQTYLRWNVLRSTASGLPQRFSDEAFNFQKVLTGAKTQQPRWQQVVAATDQALGDALGQKFVERHFPPEARQKALDMVSDVLGALRERLENSPWMSQGTREAALDKLNHMRFKIGYPERWTDYSGMSVQPQSYLENILSAREFAVREDLQKIGKPVDRNAWQMTPSTVNAYYDPSLNEFVFPAAILQPPYFDVNADDAMNYGATGATIGHEITHGFDDEGAQFDASGNLRNWWSDEDRARFQERAKGVERQFDSFSFEGIPVTGKLVLGESMADLGGLELAYRAYQRLCEREGRLEGQVGPDSFTDDQRFFLSYAQSWATQVRPEYGKLMLATDPHPIPEFRVNGPLANLPEFSRAFGIAEGQPMARPREDQNKLWN